MHNLRGEGQDRVQLEMGMDVGRLSSGGDAGTPAEGSGPTTRDNQLKMCTRRLRWDEFHESPISDSRSSSLRYSSLWDSTPFSSLASLGTMQIQVGIVTISDRASQGVYEDLGGPALKLASAGNGWLVVAEELVPDDKAAIQRAVRQCANRGAQLVLTTGGTGVGRRDVTPEAIREIAEKELPGFGEVMRMKSLALTPNAILSRSLAAVVGPVLVICLPGKPAGAVDCLGFVAAAVPHTVKVLQEVPTSC